MLHMFHSFVVILHLSYFYHVAMFQGMRNLQITPILFTTIKHETYTVENVAYACFSNNGNDDIDDAYVYEVKCN